MRRSRGAAAQTCFSPTRLLAALVGIVGFALRGLSLVPPFGSFPDQCILTVSQPLQSECSSFMAFTSQSRSLPCSESLVSLASMASSLV